MGKYRIFMITKLLFNNLKKRLNLYTFLLTSWIILEKSEGSPRKTLNRYYHFLFKNQKGTPHKGMIFNSSYLNVSDKLPTAITKTQIN
jgi:hypothetical protein